MVTLAALVLLMGITQPGGAGTLIQVYDDSINAGGTDTHVAGQPHTFAEIASSFPADFTALGTNEPSYRGLVSVQMGSAAGNATTTLTDTNKTVIWDNTRTLTNQAANLSTRFLNLGTKVGTGTSASGKDGCTLVFGAATSLSCNVGLYGCTLKTRSGALNIGPSTGPVREYVDCIIQSAASGTTPIQTQVGPSDLNLYNVDISHVTTAQVCGNLNASSAERLTISGTAPTALISSGAPDQSWKNIVFFGTPTQSDLRWASAFGTGWQLINPTFSNTGSPKFSTAITITADLGCREYWGYNVKVVDRNGVGVANIPVKLTDTLGNVLVDTLTDATGEISFGSGLTADHVPVVDHYATAGVYTLRHRSPFLSEINTGINRNTNYQSRTFTWFWHGYSTYTTTAGSFADVNDVVPIEDGSGGGTVWVEIAMP